VEDWFGERCHAFTVPGSLPDMKPSRCSVFLVRHGEVLNPRHVVYADLPGYGLSPNGRRQAASAAARLPPGITIVSSPLERAVETAAIIAADARGPVVLDEALTEWGLSGRWAGHVWEDLDIDFPGELHAYSTHPANLPFSPESLAQLAARVGGAIARHRERTGGPIAFVSHQDPIQAARLLLTGRPLADLNSGKPQHAGIVELDPRQPGPWIECGTWAPDQRPAEPRPAVR
jgi:probable phosphoglycerate mutase